jgi:hypothetical protein
MADLGPHLGAFLFGILGLACAVMAVMFAWQKLRGAAGAPEQHGPPADDHPAVFDRYYDRDEGD